MSKSTRGDQDNFKKQLFTKSDRRKDNLDNKTFWKTIKLCLSDKSVFLIKIILTYKNFLVSREERVAETWNTFLPDLKGS